MAFDEMDAAPQSLLRHEWHGCDSGRGGGVCTKQKSGTACFLSRCWLAGNSDPANSRFADVGIRCNWSRDTVTDYKAILQARKRAVTRRAQLSHGPRLIAKWGSRAGGWSSQLALAYGRSQGCGSPWTIRSCAIGRQSLAVRSAAACRLRSAEQLAASSSKLAASPDTAKLAGFGALHRAACAAVPVSLASLLRGIGSGSAASASSDPGVTAPKVTCHYARPGSDVGRLVGSAMECRDVFMSMRPADSAAGLHGPCQHASPKPLKTCLGSKVVPVSGVCSSLCPHGLAR